MHAGKWLGVCVSRFILTYCLFEYSSCGKSRGNYPNHYLVEPLVPLSPQASSEHRINTTRAHSTSLVKAQPSITPTVLGRVASTLEVTVRQACTCRRRGSTCRNCGPTPAFPRVLSPGIRVSSRRAEHNALLICQSVICEHAPHECTSYGGVGGSSLFGGVAYEGEAFRRHVGVWES